MKTTLSFAKTVLSGFISLLLANLPLHAQVFYGVTSEGPGAQYASTGVLFHLDVSTGTETVDYVFDGYSGTSWITPPGNPLFLYQGMLYGLNAEGGAYDKGTLYEWDPVANGLYVLHNFSGPEGQDPQGSQLIQMGDSLVSTTGFGGGHGKGVIFSYNLSTNEYRKLWDFDGANGEYPLGNLTYYNGKLYGVTAWGGGAGNQGYDGDGTIFEFDPVTHMLTKAVSFNGTNGAVPISSMTLLDGTFYGTTYYGGTDPWGGVIYKWTPGDADVQVMKNFSTTYPNGNGGITSLTYFNGKFYGLAGGGSEYGGVIYEWDPVTNDYTERYQFNVNTNCGATYSSMTLVNGKFYNVSDDGPESVLGLGKVYSWDPVSGTFTTLFEFSQVSGEYPYGAMPWTPLTLYSNEQLCGNDKILLCHHTGSNNNPCVELCVNENAVQAHLDHGDNLGHCSCTNENDQTYLVTGSSADLLPTPGITPSGPSPDAIHSAGLSSSIVVYPNPVNNILNIKVQEVPGCDLTIQLIGMNGRVMDKLERRDFAGDGTGHIDMSHYGSGAYLVKVIHCSEVTIQKVIVMH